MPYDGFRMEYPPNAVPHKRIHAIPVLLRDLTETTGKRHK
jgi:hypothetical protein